MQQRCGTSGVCALAVAWALWAGVPVVQASDETPRPAVPAAMAALATESLLLDLAWTARGRLVAVGERGHILLSDDFGASWRQAPSPVATTLTAVTFAEAGRGWAVGHDAVVLTTQDDGEKWEIVYRDPGFEAPFLDVLVLPDGRVLAGGAYGLYASTEGRADAWSDRILDDADFHFNTAVRSAEGDLMIAGEFGEILISADGGEAWAYTDSPYSGSFFGAVASDGWTAVFGLQGNLFVRPAGESDWQAVVTGATAGLLGGTVVPDGRLAVVGLSGTILIGDPLTGRMDLIQLPQREALADIQVAPDGHVILVGEAGILRYESLGALAAGV